MNNKSYLIRRERKHSNTLLRVAIKLSFISLIIFVISCKKLVTVDPPSTSILGDAAYNSDATAIAVLDGIYANISTKGTTTTGSFPSLSFYGGLLSDEFNLYSTTTNINWLAYYQNSLSASSGFGSEFWYNNYSPNIYACNAALEGLNISEGLSPAVRQQLLGEAKFMRAYFYFYLTNLYGDVAMPLGTDYTVNAILPRTAQAQVYQQIISDLRDAENLLVDGYVKINGIDLYPAASAERVRPNKYAAASLLSRAYLYTNKYDSAEAQANIVINNTTYYKLATLNNVFLKNSSEAIWQLQPVNIGWNTEDAKFFVYPTGVPTASNPAYLSSYLMNAFEVGDQRKTKGNWVNDTTVLGTKYTYPYKYKVYLQNNNTSTNNVPSGLTEYQMMLRLGEQYLIRAESRAQQGNIAGAQSDLNAIRNRAGLANTTASTQAALLTAILKERQTEFFAEGGHRWLDLKRTNTIDAVMNTITPAKGGGAWQSYKQLLPIGAADILKNPNLTQNPGY